MNILDQLAEYSRLRVAEDKKKMSLEEMKNIAIQTKNEKLCDFAFEKALKKDGLSFICEDVYKRQMWSLERTQSSMSQSVS